MSNRTRIDPDALKKHCEVLPGCRNFLQNFFGTCEPFEFGDNLANYMNDLNLYSPTNRHIKDNHARLMHAFTEIAFPISNPKRTMELLPKSLEQRFQEVGCQDGKGFDAVVIAKYFSPTTYWTWYATEYLSEERNFFGYVVGHEKEWGYFNLDELKTVKGPLGLGIERDLYFKERPLNQVLVDEGHWNK